MRHRQPSARARTWVGWQFDTVGVVPTSKLPAWGPRHVFASRLNCCLRLGVCIVALTRVTSDSQSTEYACVSFFFSIEQIEQLDASPFFSFTMDPVAFDAQADVSAIDRKIKDTFCIIYTLRRERNAKSGINTLPPELLARIFCLAQTEGVDYLYWNRPSILRYYFFTHVCSHWRQIAVSTPSLWSNITFIHKHWTYEMLARAKAVPLSISVGIVHQKELIKAILACMGRIRDLRLSVQSWKSDSCFDSFFLSAPLLQTLDIASMDSSEPIIFSELIFNQHAPQLTSVKLKNCLFQWSSMAATFVNVEQLEILNVKAAHIAPQAMGEVFSALCAMPRLRLLSLAHALPSSVDPSIICQPVLISSLQSIRLEDSVKAVSAFMKRIVGSGLKKIGLVCDKADAKSQEDIECSLALAYFITAYSTREGNAPQALTFVRPLLGDRQLVFGTSSKDTGNDSLAHLAIEPSNRDVYVVLPPLAEPVIEQIMHLVLHCLPLDGLTSLTIGDAWSRNEFLSIRQFEAAFRLQTIVMVGDDVVNLVEMLRPDNPLSDDDHDACAEAAEISGGIPLLLHNDARDPEQPSFGDPTTYTCTHMEEIHWPSLEKLALRGVDFNFDCDEDLYDSLCSALEQRSESCVHQAPKLRLISIQDAKHIRGSQIGELRAYADEVNWDGDEGFTEEEDTDQSEYDYWGPQYIRPFYY
jgi:hypothetical protein